jgi:hypothetical protein
MDEVQIHFNKMQRKLKNTMNIVEECNRDEIDYVDKPIGKANFSNAKTEREHLRPIPKSYSGQKKEKVNPREEIQCVYCKCLIVRRNMYQHRKSKKHQRELKVNSKLRDLLVD